MENPKLIDRADVQALALWTVRLVSFVIVALTIGATAGGAVWLFFRLSGI